MKRVLVIITNPQQASFRLRIEAVVAPLAGRGFELDVRVRPKSFLPRRALLRSAGQYHAVILQRKLLDPSDARLLRRHARRILYDIDDAVMVHAHPVGAFSRWRTWRRFEATAKILDHVVAGNEHLAEMFRQRGRGATVLPTTVEAATYRVKEHAPTQTPSLVWIGSRSTLPYVTDILKPLEEAGKRVSGLRLITIADRTLDAAPIPIEHVAWSIASEKDGLLRGDIGIAPTPCNPWTMGKCGFKIVQYMAAGLPVIASPVGANAQIVCGGETGFLANNADEWVDSIVRLASDVNLRKQMGAAGRQRVEREFDLHIAIDTWDKLLAD